MDDQSKFDQSEALKIVDVNKTVGENDVRR